MPRWRRRAIRRRDDRNHAYVVAADKYSVPAAAAARGEWRCACGKVHPPNRYRCKACRQRIPGGVVGSNPGVTKRP